MDPQSPALLHHNLPLHQLFFLKQEVAQRILQALPGWNCDDLMPMAVMASLQPGLSDPLLPVQQVRE
jgi:hypothetical protein